MTRTALLALTMLFATSFKQDAKVVYKTIGSTIVYSVEGKNVYIFSSGLMIDADGSPHAYHQDNSKALDYLANAGKPGNWWALATDNGRSNGNPVVQSQSDPAPGFYVSMTSLQDPSKIYTDPRRYVNSETIPFIVLPPALSTAFKLGDIALVVNKTNNKKCFAIFADTGPKNKIGEGSIALANALGVNSNPKNGGASSGLFTILFKNSGNGKVLTKEKIETIGRSLITDAEVDELLKL